ncbi:SpoIIE family protein phosphatase [Streptomyces sp. NPDC090106]|uniref:SpoIIE family protein phosphatase n=1 Tax=Streptomyces sp. NPDC090106 TaxID=3365946 RepID=UPI00380D9B06
MDGYSEQTDTSRTEDGADTTVLVVDDVAANRYALGAVLRRAGHRVVPVASANEALVELDVRLHAGRLPDAALVDVGLPDMNGFELCRRVKAQPLMSTVPVVHFSAAAPDPRHRCRGLDAGGDAYLTVPADPWEIQAVVGAAVRGGRRRSGAETLVRRLTRLSEAVVTVQAARCLGELARAAAEGAAGLTGGPAAVFVLGPEDEPHRGLSRHRAALAPPDASADDAVARTVTRLCAGRGGVRNLVVPSPLWPAGYFRPGVEEHARLAVAVAPRSRTPVCVATPAGRRDPADDGLLARLAEATALAAEPLLMYQAERQIALTLQHSFLPQPHRLPDLPGVDLVVRYVPASRQAEIGGDFYAAIRTGEGILVAVGDVVGHSLEAATVMVEIRHALRAHCVETSDPGVLAARLDRMLQHYHPDVTATVCLALVDPSGGRTRVANAGHLPPLLVRAGGGAGYVDACGPLLGLGLDRTEPTELCLAPGDRLLMVTDGLIETRGTDLSVSLEQLRTAAADAPADAPASLDALCDTLLGRFGHDREDDIAMLALRLSRGAPDGAG